jgi:Uma2 family endonuclease
MITKARAKRKPGEPKYSFGPGDHGRLVTDEQVANARWLEGFRYEIIDGSIYVSPIPDLSHDDLVDWMAKPLRKYAEDHPETINQVKCPARVFVPGSRRTTVPEPDLAAYAEYPFHLPIPQRNWKKISPILVAEVVSGDVAKDLGRNVILYERVPSIQEYWVVNQWIEDFFFRVFRRRGNGWAKPVDFQWGETYSTRLLPGFSLKLKPDL